MNKEHSKGRGKHFKTKEHVSERNEPKEPVNEGNLWLQCLLIFLLFFAAAIAIVKVDATCSKTIDSSDSFYLKKVEIFKDLN